MDYARIAALKMPIGSGAIESAIRRVVNLRLKGPSIYWNKTSAQAVLLVRSYCKAGRWNHLERQALTTITGIAPERTEMERFPGRSNLVYDETGTLHCYDKVSTPVVRHRMAYIGHEEKRGTLKYRCPALATTLARSGRGMKKTLGGTRLSPIAQALDDEIEWGRSCEQEA